MQQMYPFNVTELSTNATRCDPLMLKDVSTNATDVSTNATDVFPLMQQMYPLM